MSFLYLPRPRPGLTRRTMMATALAGGFLTACQKTAGPASANGASASGVVETSAGKVSGTVENGVHVFKGVPYGATTAPPRRFMPPRAPDPWTGVKEATAFGPWSPQGASTAPFPARNDLPPDFPDEQQRRLIVNLPSGTGPGEDCLVLNVWSPALDAGKRPVLVWLHGGGFSAGSGSSTWYDGTNLARRQDVVVVTINHRLNVFGYLYLGDLGGGEYADASSVGMLDCVQALQWVKDNIDRFGGDPSRVLIFGESGGARKTSTLMAMPPAAGLFNRCVVQSGSQLTLDKPEVAMERTEKFLAALGVDKSNVGALQDKSLDELLGTVAGAVDGTGQFRPVTGAPSTPRDPFWPDAPGVSRDIPMMIGSNRTEQSVFLGGDPDIVGMTDAELVRRLSGWVPEARKADVIAMYRRIYPGVRNDELLYMAGTDRGYFYDSTVQAALKSQQAGAPAFHYQFYRETPVENGRYHVPHASEIPFVFDNLDKAISIGGQPTPEAQALADRMSATWAEFARSGDPNNPAIPDWPAYSVPRRPSLVFDTDMRVEDDIRQEQRLMMETIGSQQLQGREIGPG
ncbi:MAG: carboxylesterase/lipase family protein [Hyphomonadaceae bacterium]